MVGQPRLNKLFLDKNLLFGQLLGKDICCFFNIYTYPLKMFHVSLHTICWEYKKEKKFAIYWGEKCTKKTHV